MKPDARRQGFNAAVFHSRDSWLVAVLNVLLLLASVW